MFGYLQTTQRHPNAVYYPDHSLVPSLPCAYPLSLAHGHAHLHTRYTLQTSDIRHSFSNWANKTPSRVAILFPWMMIMMTTMMILLPSFRKKKKKKKKKREIWTLSIVQALNTLLVKAIHRSKDYCVANWHACPGPPASKHGLSW